MKRQNELFMKKGDNKNVEGTRSLRDFSER